MGLAVVPLLLAFLDVFFGKHSSLSHACLEVDPICELLVPMPYDSAHDPLWENILTLEGQNHFLTLLSRMKPGGVVWFAPPCNSWIVSSQSHYGRSAEHPEGKHRDCQEYNDMAEFIAYAICACTALGLLFVVENPLSSWLFEYRALATAFRELVAKPCFVALGKAGHETLKPLRLMGTAPWLANLEAAVSTGASGAGKTLSTRVHNGWTGKAAAMDESREYPHEFCMFVAKLHMRHLRDLANGAPSGGQRPSKIRAKWARELARAELTDAA